MTKPSGKSAAALVLEKLAAAQGGKLDVGALQKLSDKHAPMREAETVLRSLHKPHAYVMRACKNCGAEFQTNYCSVAYCSDDCIVEAMAALGLKYDPFRMKRWQSSMYSSNSGILYDYEPPEFIPTETLNMLEQWARKFLEDLERLRSTAKTVETQQSQQRLEDALRDFGSFASSDDEPESQEEPEPLPEHQEEQYDETQASRVPEHPQVGDLDELFGGYFSSK